ncbi:MAG: diaminopimelate decarboxylase [Limnochordaceae bacterium]|nr:diaminopimelate decarboxylase [Limnochordaceae bacterium]
MPGTCRVNEKGRLEIGGVEAGELARRFGTPLYVFDEEAFDQRVREFQAALARSWRDYQLLYAGKAFLTTGFAALVAQYGLGLDVVSGGEIYTALQGGFPPARMVFHGNNKTVEELDFALRVGVGRVVVDSADELHRLQQVAAARGQVTPIWLRVTPGIEAHTHHYIQTGQLDSKFGVPLAGGQALAVLQEALQLPNVRLMGVHAHIGSQILDPTPFQLVAPLLVQLLAQLREQAGVTLRELDLGGGFAARYTKEVIPPVAQVVGALASALATACDQQQVPAPKLFLEPGRALVAEAGITLYRVGTCKTIPGVRTYVSVDGGMADNPRVALYQATYRACLPDRLQEPATETVTVAGRFCESGDVLVRDALLPPVHSGDLLAVFTTGAYHYSMASNYNRVPRPAVVTVRAGQAEVLVERETYADLVRLDRIPSAWRRPADVAGSAEPVAVSAHGQAEASAAGR